MAKFLNIEHNEIEGEDTFTVEYSYDEEVRTNRAASRDVIHDIIDMVFPPPPEETAEEA